MTNQQKGCRRDRLVLDTLQVWGTMDTDQIRIMFFPSARVAQRRLQKMVMKGRVKRSREAAEVPYAYYVRTYSPECLALNWARLWIVRRLKSWEVLESFDYQTNTSTVRNTVTGAAKTYNVFYNLTRKTWMTGDTVIVYDTDEQRQQAAKVIKGDLLTIDEIREGLRCAKCS